MRQRPALSALVLLSIALLVASAGCRKGAKVDQVPEPSAEAVEVDGGGRPDRAGGSGIERTEVTESFGEDRPTVSDISGSEPDDYELSGRLRTVYFAFDSFELSETTRATLIENAEWLKAHPEHGVAIEGHCDERGTIEYNLALGERRAKSVRDYLASLGLSRSRVRIVTYGEERPANPGHDEAAWSQNRRAEFVLE